MQFKLESNGLLHKGFSSRVSTVPHRYLRDLLLRRKNSIIVFTGHSLGGAAAQIAARAFVSLLEGTAEASKTLLSTRFLCLTFASPLVGDEAWRRSIDESYGGALKSRFIHIVHENDIVPRALTILWSILSHVTEVAGGFLGVMYTVQGLWEKAKEIMSNLIGQLHNAAMDTIEVLFINSEFCAAIRTMLKNLFKILEWKPAGIFIQTSSSSGPAEIEFGTLMNNPLEEELIAVYRTAHKQLEALLA